MAGPSRGVRRALVVLGRARSVRLIGAVAVWQLATGLSNVVLGWPLIAAVAHTGGAAALVVLLSILITRCLQAELTTRTSTAVKPLSAGFVRAVSRKAP